VHKKPGPVARWFAHTKEAITGDEVVERLKKIERSLELQYISKPQAEVTHATATAAAQLIVALLRLLTESLESQALVSESTTKPQLLTRSGRPTDRRSGQAANRWLGGSRRLAVLESPCQYRSEDFVPPAAQR